MFHELDHACEAVHSADDNSATVCTLGKGLDGGPAAAGGESVERGRGEFLRCGVDGGGRGGSGSGREKESVAVGRREQDCGRRDRQFRAGDLELGLRESATKRAGSAHKEPRDGGKAPAYRREHVDSDSVVRRQALHLSFPLVRLGRPNFSMHARHLSRGSWSGSIARDPAVFDGDGRTGSENVRHDVGERGLHGNVRQAQSTGS